MIVGRVVRVVEERMAAVAHWAWLSKGVHGHWVFVDGLHHRRGPCKGPVDVVMERKGQVVLSVDGHVEVHTRRGRRCRRHDTQVTAAVEVCGLDRCGRRGRRRQASGRIDGGRGSGEDSLEEEGVVPVIHREETSEEMKRRKGEENKVALPAHQTAQPAYKQATALATVSRQDVEAIDAFNVCFDATCALSVFRQEAADAAATLTRTTRRTCRHTRCKDEVRTVRVASCCVVDRARPSRSDLRNFVASPEIPGRCGPQHRG